MALKPLAVGVCILFVIPLRVRPNRPWLYWYSLALILMLPLTFYGTLIAVPFLAYWFRHRTRAYFGQLYV